METFLPKDPTSLPSLWLAKTMRLLGSDVEAMVSSGTSRNVSKSDILDKLSHLRGPSPFFVHFLLFQAYTEEVMFGTPRDYEESQLCTAFLQTSLTGKRNISLYII